MLTSSNSGIWVGQFHTIASDVCEWVNVSAGTGSGSPG